MSAVVIAIVCVVVVILLLVGFWWYRGRSSASSANPTTSSNPERRPLPSPDSVYVSMDEEDILAQDHELQKYRVNYDDIELIKVISNGSFGKVWLGKYQGKREIAVKTLHTTRTSIKEAKQFASEIKLLGRLCHPKIVSFIGVAWTSPDNLQAITEFMNCGDLRGLLNNKQVKLTWSKHKLIMARDICEALVYLHSLEPQVIHRDLKARNVLVDSEMGCKLSDFGLSRNRTYEDTMTVGIGTVRWIAPEVVLGEDYDEYVDIYSFGVVLNELDTRELPYANCKNAQGKKMQDIAIAHEVARGSLRPTFRSDCPKAIVGLSRACLQHDPRLRPSAAEVLTQLHAITFS